MLMLIALIGFPFLIWSTFKKVRLSRESAAWPTVPGVVTAAERTKVAWRTQPRVTYSYEVAGKAYTGAKVSFADAVPARETEPILSRYPVQQAVTVHYNPADPGVAVLEAGPNRLVSNGLRVFIIWYAFIILLNVAEVGLAVWQARQAAKETPGRTYDDVVASATPGGSAAAPAAASTPDLQLGNRLLRADADKGDSTDQMYVGMWYLNGSNGYAKDPVEAAKWFRKSADQGNAKGENMLANLYATGKGVDKNMKTAIEWLQKAADQNEPHACYSLGVVNEKGLGGLQKDTAKAIEWYRKAGDDPHAKEALARLHAAQ